MADMIMLQGVSSNAGKSVITKAMCRYYKNKGLKVTTFKPVLVCLDQRITNGIITDIRMEASMNACRGTLTLHNNPIQITPKKMDPAGNVLSPAIMHIDGEESFEIGLFGRDTPLFNRLSESNQQKIKQAIQTHLDHLNETHDLIIIEGAGNPTDLGSLDLTNHFITTHYPMIKTLLITKLSSGGGASSLIGTYNLMTPEIKSSVEGFIFNDYIDGEEVADKLVAKLQEFIDVPYLGLFPHTWSTIVDLPEDEQIEELARVLSRNINLKELSSV